MSAARLRKAYTKRTKNSRQRRLVREDLPLRTPRRGSGKSGPISEERDLSIKLPTPASATAPAKDGFGTFHDQAVLRCGPLLDLSCVSAAFDALALVTSTSGCGSSHPAMPCNTRSACLIVFTCP